MESLEVRHESVIQALASLKEALDLIENPYYEAIYKTLRDSAIQRFEYSIDTCWKYLKVYLQDELQITIDPISSREVLRSAFEAGLINKQEHAIFMECIADRNLTSHTYKEALAQAIMERIPAYYKTCIQL